MTNLFGRGKEPFWQQASTNLVKFVILLHQTLDDYVTLFQVYEHVINPDKLRAEHRGRRAALQRANNRRIVVDKREHLFTAALQRVDVARRRDRARRRGPTGPPTSRTRSRRPAFRRASSTPTPTPR